MLHFVDSNWSRRGETKNRLPSFRLKSQLTAFFQIPQILSASGHDVIHVPGPISYLGFLLWHLWLSHPPRTRVNIRAQCVRLTNPCAKRKVFSLTKPEGKIYKTKSLRNYITVVSEFELRSCNGVPFRTHTNTQGKDMNPIIIPPPCYGLNTTTVFFFVIRESVFFYRRIPGHICDRSTDNNQPTSSRSVASIQLNERRKTTKWFIWHCRGDSKLLARLDDKYDDDNNLQQGLI